MIDQQERYYNILKLNRWFAISSIVFLGIWLLVFADDYNRPWKKYQKEFRQLEIENIQNDITNIKKQLEHNPEYLELNTSLKSAKKNLHNKTDEIDRLNEELEKLKAEYYGVNQNYQFTKAEYDVAKFYMDQARHEQGDINEAMSKLEELDRQISTYKLNLEVIDTKMDDYKHLLKKLYNEKKTITDELTIFTFKRDLTKRKLSKIDPDSMSIANKIANIVRDLPVLDFINPYYEVKQVVVNDLEEDLIFTGMPKVDRCMTCHVSIDKRGFENAPQPFTTHPKFDLMVGSNSDHPLSEYGCTACHGGRGRGTDFVSSAHSPTNPEQAAEWKEKYDWHRLHHWDNPMLPLQYVEASCYKCHNGTMPVREAPTLSLGLAIVEKGGCFGCHQIDRWEHTPKPGPGLTKIANKTTEEFAFKWVYAPRDFKHDTWMPHFFNQINSSDEASIKRTNQEIRAIVHYLFKNSESYEMENIPHNGNPENGRMLVKSLGCMGCHRMEEDPLEDDKPSFDAMRRQQGPNLIYLGSKTNQQWIYNWIRNPQSYHPDTKMPNLRLSKQEASDISSYLISEKNEEFDARVVPDLDIDELDKIVRSFLRQTKRKEEVDFEISSMMINQKLNYAGEKLIRHYGCFSCHAIDGFENAKSIGTPLTTEGSKLISKLAFGFMGDEIEHTKWDWFKLKLTNPRIYDMIPMGSGNYAMSVKRPLEKLRMPHFGLNKDELDAIVTVILGFVKDEIPSTKLPARTTRNLIVEEGERLIQTYNCKGCHSIDGDGGVIRSTVAEWIGEIADESASKDASLVQSFSPPLLNSEGRKIQPEWLFNFFKAPKMIRPNLMVRMPTFSMISNQDWNKIIKYFQYKDGQLLAYEHSIEVDKKSDSYKSGEKIQELGACNNCHFYGSQKPKQTALSWAPNLVLAKKRLRPDWLKDWFIDPQQIMPGTKMPAPYIPTDEPIDDVLTNWGSAVASMNGDSTKLYQGLIDYVMGIDGDTDISKIVKTHLKTEGYGFVIEEDEWGDDW